MNTIGSRYEKLKLAILVIVVIVVESNNTDNNKITSIIIRYTDK